MRAHVPFELDLGVAPEGQQRLRPVLHGDEPELLQPRRLRLGPLLVGELGVGGPLPERERPVEEAERPARVVRGERVRGGARQAGNSQASTRSGSSRRRYRGPR
nr:hypothetical protein GCM10020093_084700 [Planobispora longispora]